MIPSSPDIQSGRTGGREGKDCSRAAGLVMRCGGVTDTTEHHDYLDRLSRPFAHHEVLGDAEDDAMHGVVVSGLLPTPGTGSR